MAVRNLDWYNLNEQRSYPLEDTATLISDDGTRLPHHYLVDLNIRFPKAVNGTDLGTRAHVSSLTVSSKVATVIIHSSTGERLASATIKKPLVAYKNYPLEPAHPGIGGWIVFGGGMDEPDTLSVQFSNSYQGLLANRVARPYKPLAITSLAKLNTQESLNGVVRLEGGTDIEIVKSPRVILGESRPNTIVFRLSEKDHESSEISVYEKYAGPCGGRPESRNCPNGEPIEFINTVPPDCCGNIFIEFRGCADVSSVKQDINNPMTPSTGANECGVIINCDTGLSQSCVSPDRLPDKDGKLPNEYDDNCEDSDDVLEIDESSSVDLILDGDPNADPSDTTNDTSGLPYTEDFE
jgi:hypothetical protein